FPTRSPRQASTKAAVSGREPPPAGRLQRTYLHHPHTTKSRSPTYLKLPSLFGTHKPIRETPEIRLIDRVQHLDDGPLNNLILQRGDGGGIVPRRPVMIWVLLSSRI